MGPIRETNKICKPVVFQATNDEVQRAADGRKTLLNGESIYVNEHDAIQASANEKCLKNSGNMCMIQFDRTKQGLMEKKETLLTHTEK